MVWDIRHSNPVRDLDCLSFEKASTELELTSTIRRRALTDIPPTIDLE